jgi:hypothetical protein
MITSIDAGVRPINNQTICANSFLYLGEILKFITFHVLYIIYVDELYMVITKRRKELEIVAAITITTSALEKNNK